MVYRYAKISYSAAVQLGVEKNRRKTRDGSVIINESDVYTYLGNSSFEDKINTLGGTVLTALQAKTELNNIPL